MTSRLDEALFQLRLAAFARAVRLRGLRVEQRALVEILRQEDGQAAWQAIVERDQAAQRQERSVFNQLGRLYVRLIGR